VASAEQGYPYRYAQLLSRLLGVKGEQLTEVSPELIAAIILENDRLEFSHLAEESIAAGDLFVAALAANISQTAVLNPTSSGMLIVVEGVANLTALPILLRLPTVLTGFSQITPGIPRDTRKTSGRTVGQMASRQAAAAAGNLIGFVPATSIFFPPRGLAVLIPSTAVAADTNVVNQSVEALWFWRERPVEVTETRQ